MRVFNVYVIFYACIIKCKIDRSLYKGSTENLDLRLKQHNSGKSDYTAKKLPWELVYSGQFNTGEEALNRVRYFKSAAGRRFIKKLNL